MSREVDVLALSVDATKEEALDYLSGYDLTIVPMWLTPGSQGGLTKAMATVGITHDSRIPFIALLDRKGRLVREGRPSIQALTNAVNASLKS